MTRETSLRSLLLLFLMSLRAIRRKCAQRRQAQSRMRSGGLLFYLRQSRRQLGSKGSATPRRRDSVASGVSSKISIEASSVRPQQLRVRESDRDHGSALIERAAADQTANTNRRARDRLLPPQKKKMKCHGDLSINKRRIEKALHTHVCFSL